MGKRDVMSLDWETENFLQEAYKMISKDYLIELNLMKKVKSIQKIRTLNDVIRAKSALSCIRHHNPHEKPYHEVNPCLHHKLIAKLSHRLRNQLFSEFKKNNINSSLEHYNQPTKAAEILEDFLGKKIPSMRFNKDFKQVYGYEPFDEYDEFQPEPERDYQKLMF